MTSARIDHPTLGKSKRYNFSVVHVGEMEIWFSYETPIAFRKSNGRLFARKNEWGPTTGKHLNYIDVHEVDRIPGPEFTDLLANALYIAPPVDADMVATLVQMREMYS